MTALALADVRWRSRRDPAGGAALVHAAFITAPGEHRIAAALGGVCDYVASLAGRPRREYDPDVAVAIAGDRRLAHGLAAVCLDWYRWRARTFAEALPPHVAAALAAAGVDTPSALRLRLFDLVNEVYAGFVPARERAAALDLLAATLGLGPGDAAVLDTAMALDVEGEAVLTPVAPPPSAAAVAAAYNRAVLAALLRQAERVVFTVRAPDGALVRRLYAVCRRLGVYCDVEAAGDAAAAAPLPEGSGAPVSLGVDGDGFRLTLSGPDAVVGPPAAAGPRLAAVALRLLRQLGPDDGGVAHLVLRDRPYRLLLDHALLHLPGLAGEPADAEPAGDEPRADGVRETRAAYMAATDRAGAVGERAGTTSGAAPSYDSAVEARLAREFEALRRQGRAAGWRLVREPAPLLAGGRVLIPDFALVRGGLRVFVEVAGFWTPGYIARKRAALERLAPDVPLVLAAAEGPAAALAGLPFPVVPYRDAVPVHALLAAAEERYGDFDARTRNTAARLAAACEAAAGGWIDEADLAAALGCHSPGELGRALTAAPPPPGWVYVPSAGLSGAVQRQALCAALERAWATPAPDARLSVAGVRAFVADVVLPAVDEALASVLALLPYCTVVRDSLFEVAVRPPGYVPDGDGPAVVPAAIPAPRPLSRQAAAPSRQGRGRNRPATRPAPLF